MKVFESGEGSWSGKHNFADANNVLVGYDAGQSCCEHAGWYISEKSDEAQYGEEGLRGHDVEPYNFDPVFKVDVASNGLDCGGHIAFRLVSHGKPDLFLHLFNCHNGYYSHGFSMEADGVTFHNGDL